MPLVLVWAEGDFNCRRGRQLPCPTGARSSSQGHLDETCAQAPTGTELFYSWGHCLSEPSSSTEFRAQPVTASPSSSHDNGFCPP